MSTSPLPPAVHLSRTAELAQLLDRLGGRYAADGWREEVRLARRQFDELRGEVKDDEQEFEAHIASFVEWYLIERVLPAGVPPVIEALHEAASGGGEDTLLRALALSHRSLFEVVDTFPRELLLSDLILDGLWRVDQDPPLEGIEPGDIFEARLIPWSGRVAFGAVFQFHSRQARESIHALLRQAEAGGRLGQELIATLAGMRLRHGRFPGLPLERVYSREFLSTSGER